MKRAIIGATSLAGSTACPLSRPKIRIGEEIAVECGRQFHGELHRLVVFGRPELEISHR